MHFLIGAAALLYITMTLARLISQWRLNRAVARHLPPAGGWQTPRLPQPPQWTPAPEPSPRYNGGFWFGTIVAPLITLGACWVLLLLLFHP
jgi:hypothetical protein